MHIAAIPELKSILEALDGCVLILLTSKRCDESSVSKLKPFFYI